MRPPPLLPPPPPPPRLSGSKKLLTRNRRLLPAALVALTITAAMALGCSTSAAPSSCVEAAEKAGLPEAVIEQLKKPGELNALERIALREILEKAGLDEVCDQVN